MTRHPLLPVLALSVAAIGVVGCGNDPTRPTPPLAPAVPATAPSPAPVPYVDPGFPPAPAGAAVYGRTSPSQVPGSQRYVLRDDGRFGLQYLRTDLGPQQSFHELVGTYARTDSGIRLVFEANAGRWQADATFEGDALVVRYNLEMILDDFEDGVYVRQPPGR